MDRPYIISWNLTYRCNLACEHCYLDAGFERKVFTENFSDRKELDTEGCFQIIDQIALSAKESILILTGGEPLLRRDILEIVRYASKKDLWVVVGTNGVRISEAVARHLKEAGARGMALSLDALESKRHDKFRKVEGAWENTVNGAKILHEQSLPFIVQTTVGDHNLHELEEIAEFSYETLKAKVWNLYFLVPTGRGEFISDISDEAYEQVLTRLSELQKKYFSKMMVNAKCAPHYMRKLFESDPQSPFLKTFSGGAGGCPAGTHYLGIRPNGDMTPCPYLPVFGGNLRNETFESIWNDSEIFKRIRSRNELGGRCGSCEFGAACGGCRARAFGMSGDYLAEDPLCKYQPGKYRKEDIVSQFGIRYGDTPEPELRWEEDARERISKIPRFVRGMVVNAVEKYCINNNISVVTLKELETIRSKVPTPKLFENRPKP